MEKKAWIRFTVLVALILLLFILGNRLWFFPMFKVNIKRPAPYRPPSDRPEIVTITPFEKTLKSINASGKDKRKTPDTPGLQRNPFLWSGELKKKPHMGPKPKKNVTVPKLGMIIVGQQSRSVVLDGHRVAEGETFRGHRVEKISRKAVILSGEYGKLRISISARSFGPPKVDIIEAKHPDMLIQPVMQAAKK